jgi:hypothetical protein
MALAKNLGTPRQRAEQNHSLRTNRPRRISRLRSSLPQSARRSRLDATDSRQTFVTLATVLFAVFKILPPRYRPERLMLTTSLIISTCGNQYPQLLHNQHLQIPNRKPRRINTCKKGAGGRVTTLNPVFRWPGLRRFGRVVKPKREGPRFQAVNNVPDGLSKNGTNIPFDSPSKGMKIKAIVYINRPRTSVLRLSRRRFKSLRPRTLGRANDLADRDKRL